MFFCRGELCQLTLASFCGWASMWDPADRRFNGAVGGIGQVSYTNF